MDHKTFPRSAFWLGYAGLIPQLLALLLSWDGGEKGYVAIAGGFAYAALIFSFLGGVWWGQAIANHKTGAGVYIVSVLPSLFSLALFLPWTLGWDWPGPAMLYLGALISLSPMVDRWLGLADAAFLRLRWHLSLVLGAITFVLGLIAIDLV